MPAKALTMQSGVPFNTFSDLGSPKTGISLIIPAGGSINCSNISTNGCVNEFGGGGFLGPYAITNQPAVGGSSFTANASDITAAGLSPGTLLVMRDLQAGPTDFGPDSRRTQYEYVTSVVGTTVNVSPAFIYPLNVTAAGTWMVLPHSLDHVYIGGGGKITTSGGWSVLYMNNVFYPTVENITLQGSSTTLRAFLNALTWHGVFQHNTYMTPPSGDYIANIVETEEVESYDVDNTISCPAGPILHATVGFEYGSNRNVIAHWKHRCNISGSGGNAFAIIDSTNNHIADNVVGSTSNAFVLRGVTNSEFVDNRSEQASATGLSISAHLPQGLNWQASHLFGSNGGTCVARSVDNGDMFCEESVGGCTSGNVEPAWVTCNGTAGAFAYNQTGCVTNDNAGGGTCVWTYWGKYPVDGGNQISNFIARNTVTAILLQLGLGAAGYNAQNDRISIDMDSTDTNFLSGGGGFETLAQAQANGNILSHRDKTTNTWFLDTTNSFLSSINLRGSSSGTGILQVPAATGTPSWTLPTITSTLHGDAGSGTIGSIPSCTSAVRGFTYSATDCNAACTNGGTCTTGGANVCLMECTGSAWKETGL
jgi:hypothetical protein